MKGRTCVRRPEAWWVVHSEAHAPGIVLLWLEPMFFVIL